MKSNSIYYSIVVFLFCFVVCSVNLFAEEQSQVQNSKSLNSIECQIVKPGGIPVGLNASAWEKIQKQIFNPKSEIRSSRSEGQESNTPIFRTLGIESLQHSNIPSSAPLLYGTEVKLTASDAQAGDSFGKSVAAAGDLLIVGAFTEDYGGNINSGAAYIFERNAGGANAWGQVKKLVASDPQKDDFFGKSVSVAGNVVVVGSFQEDSGGSDAGAAYIFERNTGGANAWGEVKKLTASDAEPRDFFGCSVAVAGDWLIVGAYGEDYGGEYAGAAYIFERNAGGANNWGEVKKLIPIYPQEYSFFGESVAIALSLAGDVIVVGARYEDSPVSQAGAAYIFGRGEGGYNNWGQVKKLTASDAEPIDQFGAAVAVEGSLAIIGAYQETAYIFDRNTGGANAWGEVKKLTASEPYYGYSVAVAGSVAIAGAYQKAAYIFERNTGGANEWGEVKKLTAYGAGACRYDGFGRSVAVAGDVAVVGALGDYTEGTNAGAVYVFMDLTVPPKINNDGGATDIKENSATLYGKVTYTGGEDPAVTIYLGENDGGTITGNWENAIDIGIQNGSFSNAVVGLEQNKTYYYRCYATNSAGVGWSDVTANFTTYGFPFIDITNTSPITVNYETITYEIGGTNNMNVVGMMNWRNLFNESSGSISATSSWGITSISLGVGANIISVSGTNVLGTATNDIVTIIRRAGKPFVNVTNNNDSVTYDVTTYTIGGTNNTQVVGVMSWENSLGGNGTFPVSGVWFQVSGISLNIGDNIITVSGTNIYGIATNDTVTITRGGMGTGMPLVDITNANATVNNDGTSYTIGGTNNAQVVGIMNWTNTGTGDTGSFHAKTVWKISNIPLSVGANVITLTGTNRYGISTNDTVTITRGGNGTGMPFVDVTNVNAMVNSDTTTYTIGGTNNAQVVGIMSWVNYLGGSGTLNAITPWEISGIPLTVGVNLITVTGTNIYGTSINDTIMITRPGTGPPFVDITNNNTTVLHDITNYTICGSNNINTVGMLSWSNNNNGGVGTIAVGASWWIISDILLTSGTNVITVTGTNEYGEIAVDSVVINRALVHYADLNNLSPIYPYISWSTAATNIQDAIDAADNLALVLVTNGIYDTGGAIVSIFGSDTKNRIVIQKNIEVRSVNGPEVTIIMGNGFADYEPESTNNVRGAYLSEGLLNGFTITNCGTRTSGTEASQSGAGVYMRNGNGTVSNCVISGNVAKRNGGGLYYGTINNCTVNGNRTAVSDGGGLYSATANNSSIIGNSADRGGGLYRCAANNCLISGNSAGRDGGGMYGYADKANNCLIIGNSAGDNGGGLYYCKAQNCTIIGNSAGDNGGGTYNGTIINNIVWDNTAASPASSNYYNSGGGYDYNCISPTITANDIAQNPCFIGGGDYHLQNNSPCINAGINNYASMPYDLAGNPRIMENIVDMGCYESTRGLPVISITNPASENISVPNDVLSYSVVATNANIDGNIGVIINNDITNWYAQINPFIKAISLNDNTNIIAIVGQNAYGDEASDSVIITRRIPGTGSPFVDITNANATVNNDVTSYTISGTNNTQIVGVMNWTNSLGGNGTFPVSGVWFQVSGVPLAIGTNVITVTGSNIYGNVDNDSVTIIVRPPPSDTFANAPILPDNPEVATGSNTNATTEPGEPAHAGNGGPYHSVWWNWSEPTNSLLLTISELSFLQIDTLGSDFDTVLAVYTGSAVNNLTQIAANDDAGPGIITSEVTFQFDSGQTYHIAVDGKTASDTGNITLNYAVIPEPCFYSCPANAGVLFIIYHLLIINYCRKS